MANTYTQLNLHTVFAVKNRECFITPIYQKQLFEYLGGILHENNCYPLAIGGAADHIHLLYEMNKNQSVAEQMRIVKTNSSRWINDNKFIPHKFEWQHGYAAFTVSKYDRDKVIKYINNQEEHHKKHLFKDEYIDLLKNYNIEYDEKYIFDFF